MREALAIILVTLFGCTIADETRQKNIGIFNVVKFGNDPCVGIGDKNGTCYTEDECDSRGGSASGSCAEGYGVCCVFVLACGGKSVENCTFLESTNTVANLATGGCNAQICKASDDIVQIRLDLTTFVLNGPDTSTTSAFQMINGVSVAAAQNQPVEYSTHGQCLVDQFMVSSPGGVGTPTICGTLTGEHLYVDASDACNTLSFNIGSAGTASWTIKVAQYTKDFNNLAPPGCLQYFFGTNTGVVRTFNFGQGVHLANQDQNICVRREIGQCRICFNRLAGAANAADFQVSAGYAALTGLQNGVQATGTMAIKHCGTHAALGPVGMSVFTGGAAMANVPRFDAAIIPGGVLGTAAINNIAGNDAFCGCDLLAANAARNTAISVSICSGISPFSIRFVSDAGEVVTMIANTEVMQTGGIAPFCPGIVGFQLTYNLQACASSGK